MNCVTNLYKHQVAAVEKLLSLRVGALFMEMGTGKTRTAIELVARRQERISRVVWFCPVSLKTTICREILTHTDTPRGQIYVFDDKTSIAHLPEAFWYVVGIESISSSNRVTVAVNRLIDENTFVIVDESSYIKGHNAIRTKRITLLAENARYRLVLTGTPLSQGVVDLYAQMRFLSPKILGYRSFYSFARNHLEYSEKYPGMIVRSHNTEQLAARIQPYVYQVTKDECLDLPGKIYDRRYFNLTGEQWQAYQQAKEEILLPVLDSDVNTYAIFRLFTALQQIASGFWNREGLLIEFPHRRLDVLQEIICDLPETEKVIVWCRYRRSLESVAELLRKFGEVAVFHGGLSEAERSSQVEKFRKEARFLVAMQQSGGHGLTLNEAHYAIFYENGFKYSDRIQAEDRIHRIGQEHKTTYIDIAGECGIERRISDALAKKQDVVQEFKKEVDVVKDKKDKLGKLVEEL